MKKSDTKTIVGVILVILNVVILILEATGNAILWVFEQIRNRQANNIPPSLDTTPATVPAQASSRPSSLDTAPEIELPQIETWREEPSPPKKQSRANGARPVSSSYTAFYDDDFVEFDLDVLVQNTLHYSERNLPPSERAEDCWVPPGKSVTLLGHIVEGGMVYVGRGLRSANSHNDIEPALINPALEVHPSRRDPQGLDFGYWPSYSELGKASRATYLEWLVDGKKDPTIDIGYVFLYFYGLERRLLYDGCSSEGEQRRIEGEVNRLISLYGENPSFQRYAVNLLEISRILNEPNRLYHQSPELDPKKRNFSLANKVGIAQLVKDGQPIPANWALAMACLTEQCNFRTPARRLPDLFFNLFCLRYERAHRSGMQIKPNKKRLKLHYYPAGQSLNGIDFQLEESLPDPFGLKRPIRILVQLVETCQEELEPLSRWLGRNPGEETSIRALSMIPKCLMETTSHTKVMEWRTWLQTIQAPTGFDRRELLDRWPCAHPDKPSKKDSVELACFLEKLNHGMEPDPRFQGPSLAKTERVTLFPLGREMPTSPSPSYRFATLLLHLAALVAWADDTITDEEEEHLEAQIEQFLHLSEAEQRRLKAHLHWLLQAKPSMVGLKKKIELLPEQQRQEIGAFVISVAAVDGTVAVSEIKLLEKLYTSLGLDMQQVIPQLHQYQTIEPTGSQPEPALNTSDEPSVNRETAGFTKGHSLVLDLNLLKAKRLESEKVARLLGDIFQDDDETEEPAEEVTGATVVGLDVAHTRLLTWLGEAEGRARQEVESYCAAIGLFPDGALETLNELAFNRCNESLLEDDGDRIEIDREIYEELVA